jgi:hypothetical protein
MMDKKKVLLIIFFLIAVFPLCAFSLEIKTGNGNNEGITDEAGNWLWGTIEAGDLVQIIRIHDGSSPHNPTTTGGMTGNDELLFTTHIGDTKPFGALGGFTTSIEVSVGSLWLLYCRAWNSTEASASTYYGNSETYLTTTEPDIGQSWDIHGSTNIPAFGTNVYIDTVPPGPVRNFVASQETSGDIYLSWLSSISSDATGVMVRYSTTAYPTKETEGSLVVNISANDDRRITHGGRTHLQGYYYSAFAYDGANNYSIPASSYEVSIDTLAPSVSSVGPTGGNVSSPNSISVTFDDEMGTTETQASIEVYPTVGGSWSWTPDKETVSRSVSLVAATDYFVTVETGAVDKAGNHLASRYSWSFHTISGQPPIILEMKIGGWKIVTGEVISPRPKITAWVTDPELFSAGVVSAEIQADSNVHLFTPEEFSHYYTSGGPNGILDFRLPWNLDTGTHTITLRIWDVEGNISEEAAQDLRVGSGDLIEGRKVYNYPAEVESGKGTTFAYTLVEDADINIFIRGMKGNIIWKKKISAGAPGGTGGYNEVYWNGLDNFGDGIGSGLYPAYVESGGKIVVEFNVLLINRGK